MKAEEKKRFLKNGKSGLIYLSVAFFSRITREKRSKNERVMMTPLDLDDKGRKN